jgi:thiamine-monophosphate kinase
MRSGARAGDALALFGEIGLSRAGLDILSRSLEEPVSGLMDALPLVSIASSPADLERLARALGRMPRAHEAARCIQRHLVPLARPLDASLLEADPACVTAMIDISDGLAKDLRTLCAESGVGAAIREDALPIPAAIGELRGLEGEALVDFALSSGEEYVLLAAISPEAVGRLSAGAAGAATVIGVTVPAAEGIALVESKGKKRPLPKLGYEHTF